MKAVMLVLSLLLIAGCEDRYRYPCQDPANWKTEDCERPKCDLDGTCPDQLWNKDVKKEKLETVLEEAPAAPEAVAEEPKSEETHTGE